MSGLVKNPANEVVPLRVSTENNLLVASGAPITLQVPIAAGATGLSGAVDLGNGRLARITTPAGWLACSLSLQASPDGVVAHSNLYDKDGVQYALVTVAGAQEILVPLVDALSLRYLKLRSGLSGAAVNQTGAPTLTLTLLP